MGANTCGVGGIRSNTSIYLVRNLRQVEPGQPNVEFSRDVTQPTFHVLTLKGETTVLDRGSSSLPHTTQLTLVRCAHLVLLADRLL